MESDTNLNGRVAAVTGGGRGIGRATAEALARAGAKVAIGDIHQDAAERAAAEIGAAARGYRLDVTDRASFEGFLEAVEHDLGNLEVLVNNAGIQHVGPLAEESDGATERQIAVNLIGLITGTKLALGRMLPRRSGHIVNMASATGKTPTPGGATYSATKHAVVGLTESLRGEIRGSGVELSVIYPAIIGTEMADGIAIARGMKMLPPEEVGGAIVRCIDEGRADAFVPGWSRWVNAAMSTLPRPVAGMLRRAMRIDAVLTAVDPTARAGYESRATGPAPEAGAGGPANAGDDAVVKEEASR